MLLFAATHPKMGPPARSYRSNLTAGAVAATADEVIKISYDLAHLVAI